MYVARITSAGVFDTTFGNGASGTNVPGVFGITHSGITLGNGIVTDAAGNIYVAGGDSASVLVWKIFSDGTTLDTVNFASPNGFFAKTGTAGGCDFGIALARDAVTGRLVVAGNATTACSVSWNTYATVWAIDSSGHLDTSFNNTQGFQTVNYAGWQAAPTGSFTVQGFGVAMDASHIVMTGVSDGLMSVWRFTTAGAVDATFGNVEPLGPIGSAPYYDPTTYDNDTTGEGVLIDSTGNIVVGGFLGPVFPTAPSAAVWRIKP